MNIVFIFFFRSQGPSVPFLPVDAEWQKERAQIIDLKIQNCVEVGSPVTKPVEYKPTETVPIRGDGNCFFRSLSYWITGAQNSHKMVRQILVRYMNENKDAIAGTADENYLSRNHMSKDGEYGTDVEIFASASFLNTSIYVFAPWGEKFKWQHFAPLKETTSAFQKAKGNIYLCNINEHFEPVTHM